MTKRKYKYPFVVFIMLCLSFSAVTLAQTNFNNPISSVEEADIEKALSSTQHFSSLNDRIISLSGHFLGRPYFLGPAGEGEDGDLDQKPLSTWELFDCVTYVEAVMALAMINPRSRTNSINLEMYYENIKQIKYHSDEISFLTRNHFTELDWIPHLNRVGILKDITKSIYFFAPTQYKIIDKHQWFMQKTLKDLYLPQMSDEEKIEALNNFKDRVVDLNLQPQKVGLKYIPFKMLKLSRIQSRLPKVSIFSLIRDNHPTNPNIPVMVSHQGLLIRKVNGELYIRHASTSGTKTVMDVALNEYIEMRFKDAPWTSLGLNLQVMR
jgi:hypothetical protein